MKVVTKMLRLSPPIIDVTYNISYGMQEPLSQICYFIL